MDTLGRNSAIGLSAIVVDDEDLARGYLCRLLQNEGVEVLAEGENGVEALKLSEIHRPDILFLDIRMAELNGIEAAEALTHFAEPPLIVFATAHPRYAIEAIEWNAFDYLVKPISPDRLTRTIDRAARRLEAKNQTPKSQDPSRGSAIQQSLRRLPVRTKTGIRLLRTDEIEWAVCNNKSVVVRVNEVDHRVNYSLSELEEILPSDDFIRIHASVLARLSRIETFNYLGNHAYSVTMLSGLTLPVGRNYHTKLQMRLGIRSDRPIKPEKS